VTLVSARSILLTRYPARRAAGALAILEHFGLTALTDALKKSGGIHEVWNLLSLEPNLHSKFDHLNLWFESTSQVCYSETWLPSRLTTRTAKPL